MTAAVPTTDRTEAVREILRCRANAAYFIHRYVTIETDQGVAPFRLWPAQAEAVKVLRTCRLTIILKARQIGMTTVVIANALHVALFEPGSTILLFSKGQRESKELIRRIREMTLRLPKWLQPRRFVTDGAEILAFTNGSRFLSFASASSGGDSYTARMVVIDEADLIKDLDLVLSGCKPTIDAGGDLVLLSRTDKKRPDSPFKRVYRSSAEGKMPYRPIFLPWWERPDRDRAWYEAQKVEIEGRTGWLDELYSNYPATADEALAALEQDKRFPVQWLDNCLQELKPIDPKTLPSPFSGWQGLEIYFRPQRGEEYAIGVDVANGNPNSDDSVIIVVHVNRLEEVAVLCFKVEPQVLAQRVSEVSKWYGNAKVYVERNNHGHTMLAALRDYKHVPILKGRDDKAGWWTDQLGKTLMYDLVAEYLRQGSAYNARACVIHSKATRDQLGMLDVIKQEAPEGFHDDRAMAFGLALMAATKPVRKADLMVMTGAPEVEAKPAPKEYQGVRFVPTYQSWWVKVERNGQANEFGEFDTAEQAAHAYDVARELLGMEPVNRVELKPEEAEAVRRQVRQQLAGKR
jgi:hypothetical protein